VLAVVAAEGRRVSEVCRKFDPLPQLLENVRYNGGDPLEAASVKTAIKSGEEKLGPSGRLVIRKSGTEPVIRVMGEGEDESLVKAVVAEICAAVEKAA
jgi:phosphoglucosamine mutase